MEDATSEWRVVDLGEDGALESGEDGGDGDDDRRLQSRRVPHRASRFSEIRISGVGGGATGGR